MSAAKDPQEREPADPALEAAVPEAVAEETSGVRPAGPDGPGRPAGPAVDGHAHRIIGSFTEPVREHLVEPLVGGVSGAIGHVAGAVGPVAAAGGAVAAAGGAVANAGGHVVSAVGQILGGVNEAVGGRELAIARRLRGRARQPLANLFEVHPEARDATPREIGVRFVPLEEIVGTAVAGGAQRGGDFLPLPPFRSDNWRSRWQRIQRANRDLVILPPVSLVRFADGYWVEDGHNRVAAALYADGAGVDAVVIELVPLDARLTQTPSGVLGLLAEADELRAQVFEAATAHDADELDPHGRSHLAATQSGGPAHSAADSGPALGPQRPEPDRSEPDLGEADRGQPDRGPKRLAQTAGRNENGRPPESA